MIRLQDRDMNILRDIGICELMTYQDFLDLGYFNTYDASRQRMSALQRQEYVESNYYNTDFKVFRLTNEGIGIVEDILGERYEQGTYKQVHHKLARTQLYASVKGLGITEWTNEVVLEDINKIVDVSFDYKDSLYLVEVHNEQKTKVLRKKLGELTDLKVPFTLIIYCKNKNVVNNMLDKMNKKGFDRARRYGLKVYQFGDRVGL